MFLIKKIKKIYIKGYINLLKNNFKLIKNTKIQLLILIMLIILGFSFFFGLYNALYTESINFTKIMQKTKPSFFGINFSTSEIDKKSKPLLTSKNYLQFYNKNFFNLSNNNNWYKAIFSSLTNNTLIVKKDPKLKNENNEYENETQLLSLLQNFSYQIEYNCQFISNNNKYNLWTSPILNSKNKESSNNLIIDKNYFEDKGLNNNEILCSQNFIKNNNLKINSTVKILNSEQKVKNYFLNCNVYDETYSISNNTTYSFYTSTSNFWNIYKNNLNFISSPLNINVKFKLKQDSNLNFFEKVRKINSLLASFYKKIFKIEPKYSQFSIKQLSNNFPIIENYNNLFRYLFLSIINGTIVNKNQNTQNIISSFVKLIIKGNQIKLINKTHLFSFATMFDTPKVATNYYLNWRISIEEIGYYKELMILFFIIINLIILFFLGFIIWSYIKHQTKHFAHLKALGYNTFSLVIVSYPLSLFSAILGFIVGFLISIIASNIVLNDVMTKTFNLFLGTASINYFLVFFSFVIFLAVLLFFTFFYSWLLFRKNTLDLLNDKVKFIGFKFIYLIINKLFWFIPFYFRFIIANLSIEIVKTIGISFLAFVGSFIVLFVLYSNNFISNFSNSTLSMEKYSTINSSINNLYYNSSLAKLNNKTSSFAIKNLYIEYSNSSLENEYKANKNCYDPIYNFTIDKNINDFYFKKRQIIYINIRGFFCKWLV